MNQYQVDLTNCDKEPIHIPGKIQSHGFLVAVNSTSHQVTYISENIKPFIDDDAKNYLDKHINELEARLKLTGTQLKLYQIVAMGNGYENVSPFLIFLDGKPYNLIANVSASDVILEFE